jgi:hypothetical protein
MARERALTKLELDPARVAGDRWVRAKWLRADGSGGTVYVELRRKTERDWYIAQLTVDEPTGELLRDVPLARIRTAANASKRIRRWVQEGVRQRALQRERRVLKRPAGRRLDADFYAEVALAYIDAVELGLNPAKTLADDADVPQGTVNRWIATARKPPYSLLPATTPGRARAHG